MNTDTYQAVNDRILAKLEQGEIPWKNPRRGKELAGQFARFRFFTASAQGAPDSVSSLMWNLHPYPGRET
jgi:hypothetical protein